MTVSATYKPLVYKANGVTTTFAITWKFFNKELSVQDETGAEYNRNLYTIFNSETNSGGSIAFKEPPASSKIVKISRKVPLTQDVTFVEGENFPAEDYEYSLDRIYMILQQYGLTIDKALTLPDGYGSVDEFVNGVVHLHLDGAFDPEHTYKRGDLCWELGVLGYTSILWIRTGVDIKGVRPSDNTSGWTALATSGVSEEAFNDLSTRVDNVYTKSEIDRKIGDIDNVLDVINGEVI
jgi:hypothetical protein